MAEPEVESGSVLPRGQGWGAVEDVIKGVGWQVSLCFSALVLGRDAQICTRDPSTGWNRTVTRTYHTHRVRVKTDENSVGSVVSSTALCQRPFPGFNIILQF